METPIYDSSIERPHIILGTAQRYSEEVVKGEKREVDFKSMMYVILKSTKKEIEVLMDSIKSKEPDSYPNELTSMMGKVILMGSTDEVSGIALRDMIPVGEKAWTDTTRTFYKSYRKRDPLTAALVLMHQDPRNSFKEAIQIINADYAIVIKLHKPTLRDGNYYFSSFISVQD